MKYLSIFIITMLVSILSCRETPKQYGSTSFGLDSSKIDLGIQTINYVLIGSSEQFNTTNFTARNGVDGVEGKRKYDLDITHLNGSFNGEGVYDQNSNIKIRFVYFDIFGENPTYENYEYSKIDSLWLKYSKVSQQVVKGEFFIKVSSEDVENSTFTLKNGEFEFSNYEDTF